jgi:hypothetical protein
MATETAMTFVVLQAREVSQMAIRVLRASVSGFQRTAEPARDWERMAVSHRRGAMRAPPTHGALRAHPAFDGHNRTRIRTAGIVWIIARSAVRGHSASGVIAEKGGRHDGVAASADVLHADGSEAP